MNARRLKATVTRAGRRLSQSPTLRGAARSFALVFPLMLLGVMLALAPGTAAESDPVQAPVVRILLERKVEPFPVKCAGRVEVRDAQGRAVEGTLPPGIHTVTRAGSRLKIGSVTVDQNGARLLPAPGHALVAFGHAYAGALLVQVDAQGALLIVNLVDLESYVAGVVGHEIGFKAPPHAQAAQAVAARTYAVARAKEVRTRDPGALFDLYDDTRAQVYGGVCTDPGVWKAVWGTRGQVMTDRGRVFPAYYHAVCGGRTEPAESVFPKDRCPPLQGGVACTGCRRAARYAWIATLPEWRIRSRLNASGFSLGPLQSIVPVQETAGGRVARLLLTWAPPPKGGSLRVAATDFRMLAGDTTIRSTRFRVVREADGYRFEGEGWGHGVGLCQEGAIALARAGRTVEQILGYYYPGHTMAQAYET